MKAVIFDLDGTLLNTLEDLASSMNYVLRNYHFPEHSLDQYRFFVGNGMVNLVKKAAGLTSQEDSLLHQMFTEMKEEYNKNWHKFTQPYDGIKEMLLELSGGGICLTILSNKPDCFTEDIVHHFFPHIHFQCIMGASDSIPKKPDPSGAEYIIRKTGFLNQDFIFIGDSQVDIQTAIHAKIFPAGVLWGFRDRIELEKAGAKYLFYHPNEISSFLLKSN